MKKAMILALAATMFCFALQVMGQSAPTVCIDTVDNIQQFGMYTTADPSANMPLGFYTEWAAVGIKEILDFYINPFGWVEGPGKTAGGWEWYEQVYWGRRETFLTKEDLRDIGYDIPYDRDIPIIAMLSWRPPAKGRMLFAFSAELLPKAELVALVPLIPFYYTYVYKDGDEVPTGEVSCPMRMTQLSPDNYLAPAKPGPRIGPSPAEEINQLVCLWRQQRQAGKLATAWGRLKTRSP